MESIVTAATSHFVQYQYLTLHMSQWDQIPATMFQHLAESLPYKGFAQMLMLLFYHACIESNLNTSLVWLSDSYP